MSQIFISYAADDQPLARQLYDDLVEAGYHPPFLASNLEAGKIWEEELLTKVRQCRYLLIVHTASWVERRYPLAEYLAARILGRDVRILRHDDKPSFRKEVQDIDFGPEADRQLALDQLKASLYTADLRIESNSGDSNEPYRGLAAYRPADARLFRGRERDVTELSGFVNTLRDGHRMGVVFGPSGCGKSSLLGAGIRPKVDQDLEWASVTLSIASSDPFGDLAARLAPLVEPDPTRAHRKRLTRRLKGWDPRSDEVHPLAEIATEIRQAREAKTTSQVAIRLLIIVDQFEQFLLADGRGRSRRNNHRETEVGRVLPFLLAGCEAESPDRPVVVIAIRTDHLSALDTAIAGYGDHPYREFPVGRMSRGGLEQAIREPAMAADNIEVEDALVAELADQVGDADALPLLSFSLQTLYRNRDGRKMTMEAYNKLGGVSELVDKEAERIHEQVRAKLDATDQVQFDQALIAMASPSGENAWIRRPLPLADLSGRVEQAVDQFVEGRIFSTGTVGDDDRPVVQPAHDMVLTHWSHLANLLEISRRETLLRDRILQTKKENGRLTGSMLDDAIDLLGNKKILLDKSTRRWVGRAKWRRRFARTALGVIAIGTTVLAGVAFALAVERDAAVSDAEAARDEAEAARAVAAAEALDAETQRTEADRQRIEAENQAAEAERQRTEAEAAGLTVAATLARVNNPALAAGLTIEAIATGAGTEAGRRQLLYEAYEAMDRIGQPYPPLTGHDASVWALAFDPDGTRLATGGDDGTVRFWNWVTNEPAGDGVEIGAGIRSLAFSSDGSTLAVAGLRPQVTMWDLVEDETTVVEHERGAVLAVAFSPDGSVLASGGGDSLIRLWSPAGASLGELDGHDDGLIAALAFSPDGAMLASSDFEGRVFLWDVDGREIIARLEGSHRPGATVSGLAWSSDGTMLATAGDDELVVVWTVDQSAEPLEMRGHTNTVVSVDFTPDDKVLVTAGNDQTIRLWDSETGAELDVLRGHEGWVRAVGISPDGDRVASVSTDQTVRTWRTGGGDAIDIHTGHRGWVFGLAALDRGRLASGGGDGRLRIWSATGELEEEFEPRTMADGGLAGLRRLSVAATGSFLAVPGNDGLVEVYSSRTFDRVSTFDDHNGFVYATAFSPDGARVASAGDDEVVRIWETTSGIPLDRFTDADAPIYGLAWSPDGRLVAAADADGAVRIWREDGTRIATLTEHLGIAWDVAWAPGDRRQLASAGADGTIRLWEPSDDGDSATGDSVGSVWAEVAELSDHTAAALSVEYSADGRWLVSTSDDGTVRVWDVEAAALHVTLNGHTETTWDALFIDDDRTLVSTGDDSTIRLTPLLPEVVPGEPVPLCEEVARFVTSAQVIDSLPRPRQLQGCTNLD